MFDKALFYIFILSLVLVLVAYYAGVQTEAPALANSLQTIIFSATGRNSNGKFAGYPGGGPTGS